MSERVKFRFSLDPKRFGDVIELIESFPKTLRGECIAVILRYYKDKVQALDISEIPMLKGGLRHDNNINIKVGTQEKQSKQPEEIKEEELDGKKMFLLNAFR